MKAARRGGSAGERSLAPPPTVSSSRLNRWGVLWIRHLRPHAYVFLRVSPGKPHPMSARSTGDGAFRVPRKVLTHSTL